VIETQESERKSINEVKDMLIENQESERKSINEVKDMLTQLIQAQKEDEKQKNYARDALNIVRPG